LFIAALAGEVVFGRFGVEFYVNLFYLFPKGIV
jgi:hypothetical protein